MPILGYFRTLRKNKNPFICRRELVWAVQDSNLRPPGCKLSVVFYFTTTYKTADSYQSFLCDIFKERGGYYASQGDTGEVGLEVYKRIIVIAG